MFCNERGNSSVIVMVGVAVIALVGLGAWWFLSGASGEFKNPLASSGELTAEEVVAVTNGIVAQLGGGSDGECFSNMEMMVREAEMAEQMKEIGEEDNQRVSPRGEREFVCPDEGEYAVDGLSVSCSVHGSFDELNARIVDAGTLTFENRDDAYEKLVGKFVVAGFNESIKDRFVHVPVEVRADLNNFIICNSLYNAFRLSDFSGEGVLSIEDGVVSVSNNNFVDSMVFERVDGVWLLKDVVFSVNYFAPVQ